VPLSDRACVEQFHLVFVRALFAKGEDKARIALKGGCNLRFFFGSPRYSEDIDFDAAGVAKTTLTNKVERLLQSPLVSAPLRASGLEVVDVSAPKQTDTTQRWKVGLRAPGLGVDLRTKLEFSQRDAIEGAAFEPVAREVLRSYALTQVLATHYSLSAAISQKVAALAGRVEPQARDIFDLQLLLARMGTGKVALANVSKKQLTAAIDRAMSVSFDEYRSKVVAYLHPDQAALYDGREAWDAMQESVVDALQALS
jgi:predicted nucleotidyltransferase component of viral defense system